MRATTILVVLMLVFTAVLAGCGGGGGSTTRPPIDDPGTDTGANQAPAITSISPATTPTTAAKLTALQQVSINVAAVDPDNDPLTYQWSTDRGSISGSGQSAMLTAPNTAGAVTVTIRVSDNHSHTVQAQAYFVVDNGTPPTNSAPTVTVDATPATVDPGGISNIIATANDPDGDPLTFQWNPNAGTIQTNNGTSIVWVAPTTPGTYAITVLVSDNKAPAVSASVSVKVGTGGGGSYTNGLLGKYYQNDGHQFPPEFGRSTLVHTRVDPNINFNWGFAPPFADMVDTTVNPPVAHDFMVRWTGHIRCDAPGTYQFRVTQDDGARLLVGNDQGQMQTVIDKWNFPSEQLPGTETGSISGLAGNKWYAIQLDYFEDESRAYVYLEWLRPGATDWEIVPTNMLRTD